MNFFYFYKHFCIIYISLRSLLTRKHDFAISHNHNKEKNLYVRIGVIEVLKWVKNKYHDTLKTWPYIFKYSSRWNMNLLSLIFQESSHLKVKNSIRKKEKKWLLIRAGINRIIKLFRLEKSSRIFEFHHLFLSCQVSFYCNFWYGLLLQIIKYYCILYLALPIQVIAKFQ